MPLRPRDLHPVVLCHITRFFGAARLAVARDTGGDLKQMIAFAGNMVWAHSGVDDHMSTPQKRALAIAGGAAGGIAEQFDVAQGSSRTSEVFDALERDMLASIDGILEVLIREIDAAGAEEIPASVIDAFVWRKLFVGYPWPCGQSELEEAIAARLPR